MNRPLLAVGVASILASGCFGEPAKTEHFYFLTGPSNRVERGDGPRLSVGEFSAGPGYDSQRIAYRVGEHELRYYGFRQWIAEPAKLLTAMVVRHLRRSGRFAQVDIGESVKDPDGILEGHVVAMEEVDETEKEKWYGHLAMRFLPARRAHGQSAPPRRVRCHPPLRPARPGRRSPGWSARSSTAR